jgi:polysaccharide export outer membrane protein
MLNKSGVLTLLLCLTLASCGWIPGPDLDASRIQDDLSVKTGTSIYRVKLINADVIAAQVQDASKSGSLLPPQPPEMKGGYRVGAGDILGITVWGHPELAANGAPAAPAAGDGNAPTRGPAAEVDGRGLQVAVDGTIYFPTLGRIPVAGKTTGEISGELIKALNEKLRDPQLDVRVTQFRSQWVHLAGQVKNPGSLPITDLGLSVVDAIARSGGTLADADLQRVQLTRAGKPYVLDVQRTLDHGRSS